MGGGDGNDSIRGTGGNDEGGAFKCPPAYGLFGFEGNDRLAGGRGSDGLVGLEGADILAGGAGNDYLDAKSAGKSTSSGNDILRCGGGFDRYSVSANDAVDESCERRVPVPVLERARHW
jgi:Ca2+-binding RTX toxin-like protein